MGDQCDLSQRCWYNRILSISYEAVKFIFKSAQVYLYADPLSVERRQFYVNGEGKVTLNFGLSKSHSLMQQCL